MSEQIKELLDQVVKLQIKQSFNKEYRDEATPQEALGIAISQYFEWDGQAIFETASRGFEDSNFHTFNSKFEGLWNKEVLKN